jgi:hypothetical protein
LISPWQVCLGFDFELLGYDSEQYSQTNMGNSGYLSNSRFLVFLESRRVLRYSMRLTLHLFAGSIV